MHPCILVLLIHECNQQIDQQNQEERSTLNPCDQFVEVLVVQRRLLRTGQSFL